MITCIRASQVAIIGKFQTSWSNIYLKFATFTKRNNGFYFLSFRFTKNILLAQDRQKKAYDSHKKKVKTFTFKVGEEVLKANKRKEGRKGGKLQSNWTGPFSITSISEKGVDK